MTSVHSDAGRRQALCTNPSTGCEAAAEPDGHGFIVMAPKNGLRLTSRAITGLVYVILAAPIALSFLQLAEIIWPGVFAAVFGAGQ
jgi:hypothetical protein